MACLNKTYSCLFIPAGILVGLFITLIYSCEKLEVKRILKIQTGSVDNVTYTSSNVEGAIVDIGEGEILEHGHVWARHENPTTEQFKTNLGTRQSNGVFVSNLEGLDPGVTYFTRAYASKGSEVFYAEQESFTTQALEQADVTTLGVVNITSHSAECGGNVIHDGGSSITNRGVCWNVSPSPSLNSPHTINGSGLGDFSSSLLDLVPGTEYFVRAYATNGEGTAYGNELVFSTHPVLPELSTSIITEITTNSAISGGNVTYDGGAEILAHGICWNTKTEPTTEHFLTNDGGGIGLYNSNMTNLTTSTTYYVRAYAINIAGTQYGDEKTFTTDFNCGTRLTDERDGKTYLTVQIGTQCWMSENLNIGSMIPVVDDQTDNQTIEKYCYDDDQANCDLYGGIYQWNEMMQYLNVESTRGVCPDGWHLPSDYEWKILEMSLGMSQESADSALWRGTNEGGKLKAAGTYFWDEPNEGSTNSSIFTALPAGMSWDNGTFSSLGFFAVFWTSTSFISEQAWYRLLDADHSQIYRVDGYRPNGTSVRCVKD